MKSWKGFLLSLVLVTLVACSEQPKPEDTFTSYMDAWEKGEYGEMYELLSEGAKEGITKEEFTELYTNSYEKMSMENLEVTYGLSEEQNQDKESSPVFDFDVTMETIGGKIDFSHKAELIYEEGEETDRWAMKWAYSMIFLEMEEGDTVQVDTVSPERGEIYDVNGEGLAVKGPVLEVGIVPGVMENEEELKKRLSEILGLSVEKIDQKLNQSWVKDDLFVPLAMVADTDKKRLDAILKGDLPRGYKVISGKKARVYPLGEAAAHLTGYVGNITAEELEERKGKGYSSIDRIGKSGLELVYEEKLRGTPGFKVYITKDREEAEDILLTEKPVQNGEDLTLTIAKNVQETVYKEMEDDSGTAAAINPSTGEVKALVSTPAYDPTALSLGLSSEGPTLNKFTRTYSPGSTFKPITASIGIETGTIQPDEEMTINGETYKAKAGYKVTRVPSAVDTQVNLRDALVRSDNIYFARKIVEMGVDTFQEQARQFGFNEDLPFPYSIQKSQLANENSIGSESLLAATGYGQGEVEMSSLHLAMTYTPFVTGGTLLKPTLLADEGTGQAWHENVISQETASLLTERLKAVVEDAEGTAHDAVIEGLKIAGKTGSAELKRAGEEDGQVNGWFVAWNTESNNLLVSMMIEDAEDGSHEVVPKVKSVLDQHR
ncbi:penicillin-binding transpeptidase domain-containing protein [Pontibacillus sp. ALD_SL1]|uniref:penicillin-binding transpeptidase domain-containing protein n=1 Tax=Pontibacillus sp. ALD_SL1 TaxID=2777185 RepID=UPI001A972356|nr:penicillin-binding transpeptidase domain-containing protein [Pontibacillus sp. ALD_SL1]QSS98732.1 penicillin-binding transpeptidase domain-containing protein [Pontibacillus sp. ALD_SL1]